MPETPLAYASDDDDDDQTHGVPLNVVTPTAVRVKHADDDAASKDVSHLQKDNALLRRALSAAQQEIISLKSQPTTAATPTRFLRGLATPNGHARAPRTTSGLEDPFAPQPNEQGMTLEGTLHSLQMQTAQLLEINDDFIAEQDRWNSKRKSLVPSAS